MAEVKCGIEGCFYGFSKYGRFNSHDHKVGKSSIHHELQQWFCGAGHENWDSRAW